MREAPRVLVAFAAASLAALALAFAVGWAAAPDGAQERTRAVAVARQEGDRASATWRSRASALLRERTALQTSVKRARARYQRAERAERSLRGDRRDLRRSLRRARRDD